MIARKFLFPLFPLFLFFLFPCRLSAAAPELEKRFDEAILLFQEGRDKAAEAILREILQKDPALIRPRQLLGLIYARTKRPNQALDIFREIIKMAPRYWGGYYGLGLVLKQRKAFDAASEAFYRAIARSRGNPKPWRHLAQIAETQNRMQEAAAAYRQVIALSRADSKEVRGAIRRLEEIGKDPETAVRVQELMQKATAIVKRGDPKEAIPLYEEVTALLPRGRKIRHILGNVAVQAGDPERAEAAFQEAIEIDPAYLKARFALGRLYQLTGRVPEAIAAYEAILAISRNEAIQEVRAAKAALFPLLDLEELRELTQDANRLVEEGDLTEAEAKFQAAVAIDPEKGVSLYNLAQFYHQSGQQRPAREAVRRGLALEPDSRGFSLLLGAISQKQHLHLKAMRAYVKAISLTTDRASLSYREALAGLFQNGVQFSRARIDASVALAKGLRKREEGLAAEAFSLIVKAAVIAPEDPVIAFYLGSLYREMGEERQAFLQFKKAVALHRGFYSARLALAELALGEKMYVTAVSSLQALLRLGDPDLDRLKIPRKELEKRLITTIRRWQGAREKTRLLFEKGMAATARGEMAEAVSKLGTAVKAEPENPSLLFSLGIAYASAKRWEAAETVFNRLFEIDPAHPGGRFRLGFIQEARGLLFKARRTYREILRATEEGTKAYLEAEARVSTLDTLIEKHKIAARHEKRGLATLKAEDADEEGYEIALWDLKQAVALRPDAAQYHYNLGLLQERIVFGKDRMTEEIARKIWENPNLLDDPIASYRTAIEKDPRYLPAYTSLAWLYAAKAEREQAIDTYKKAMTIGLDPDLPEIKTIERGIQSLEKRFSGSAGFTIGYDGNFTLTNPPASDLLNTLSINLAYVLLRGKRWEIPLSYVQQSTAYYRSQTLVSSQGLSIGLKQSISYAVSYQIDGRYQAGYLRGEGLSSLLAGGRGSLSYRSAVPTRSTLDYAYTDIRFRSNTNLNRTVHQAGFSLTQRLFEEDEAGLTYAFLSQSVPAAQDNTFREHQIHLLYRKPLGGNVTFRGSGGLFFQDFLHPDSKAGKRRRNTLLSYGAGLTFPWADGIILSLDYSFRRNRSNLGPTVLDRNDIAEGRSSAHGDYKKRIWTVRADVAF